MNLAFGFGRKNKMKIAFINKYQYKVNRGAETFVSELSYRLSKNHEVDILTSIPFWKKYDLIIPTNGRFQVVIVRLLTWLKGAKMLVSGQSGIGLDDRINLYSFPDAFIALSDHASNWAKKINGFVKTVKIPNGVDLTKFKIPNSKFRNKVVLSVGAFTSEKKHDLTIKAVSKLGGCELIIVGGGGELKQEIKMLGEKMLGDRFEIMSLPRGKMPGIYNKACVFTYPTVAWESFGIAIVEAMASGLPVVANDDPIRREIIGDAGLFVDPTDTDEYAKAIEKAISIDWGSKPRKQAEKFDWDKIALEYEKLFKELIK